MPVLAAMLSALLVAVVVAFVSLHQAHDVCQGLRSHHQLIGGTQSASAHATMRVNSSASRYACDQSSTESVELWHQKDADSPANCARVLLCIAAYGLAGPTMPGLWLARLHPANTTFSNQLVAPNLGRPHPPWLIKVLVTLSQLTHV